jgi:hypothetical protein
MGVFTFRMASSELKGHQILSAEWKPSWSSAIPGQPESEKAFENRLATPPLPDPMISSVIRV